MNYWICSTKSKDQWLKLSTLVLSFMLLLSAHVSAADFGIADWGMTREEVIKLESRTNLTPFDKNDYLIYAIDLNGIDTTRIVYQFSNNRLVEGRFIFKPENRLDFAQAIRQYTHIVTMISSQYGQPVSNEQIHRFPEDALQTHAPLVNELAADRLILKTRWQTENTLLVHQLAWNNNEPHHQIHYTPVQLSPASADQETLPGQSF
jgi:hypothetical protein